MRQEKASVRRFYDSFGWERTPGGRFHDTDLFVDARPVLESYTQRTRRRVRNFIKPRGEFLLDAGGGPIPHAEHLEYSDGYRFRVCADFSLTALAEARAKLGDRGLFVQADLTHLPFRAGVFDAMVAAHVLYHIPADEQATAVREFHRTLAPDGDCVIVYKRTSPALTALAVHAARIRRNVARVLRRAGPAPPVPQATRAREADAAGAPGPRLYFHAHEPSWFLHTFPPDWTIDVRSAKSVDRFFSRSVVPDNALGRGLLALVFWLEETFPHLMARVGSNLLVVISKRP